MSKYLPWILLGVCLAFAVPFFYKQVVDNNSLKQALLSASQELTEAKLEIGRAETRIADAKGMVSKLEKTLQEEIDKRKAVVIAYGELQGVLEAEKKKVKTLTKIVYKDKPGTIDIPKGKLFIKEDDGTYSEIQQMTLEYKDFRIDIESDCLNNRLSYKLHQKFEGQYVETKLPTGQFNHYLNLWELDDKDTRVNKVALKSFVVVKTDPDKNTFHWFNPKLDILFGGGLAFNGEGTWLGELGISVASYGKTKNDLSWRFVRFGAGLTRHGFSMTFSPVQFNIARSIPLISNCWLSPYFGWDTNIGTFHAGLGISVVL